MKSLESERQPTRVGAVHTTQLGGPAPHGRSLGNRGKLRCCSVSIFSFSSCPPPPPFTGHLWSQRRVLGPRVTVNTLPSLINLVLGSNLGQSLPPTLTQKCEQKRAALPPASLGVRTRPQEPSLLPSKGTPKQLLCGGRWWKRKVFAFKFRLPLTPHLPRAISFLKRPQLGILLPPLSATWAPSLGRSPPPPPRLGSWLRFHFGVSGFTFWGGGKGRQPWGRCTARPCPPPRCVEVGELRFRVKVTL